MTVQLNKIIIQNENQYFTIQYYVLVFIQQEDEKAKDNTYMVGLYWQTKLCYSSLTQKLGNSHELNLFISHTIFIYM